MPPIINYETKTVVATGAATGVGAALADTLLIDNGLSAAITTNQIDYSTVPAVDSADQLISLTGLHTSGAPSDLSRAPSQGSQSSGQSCALDLRARC